MHRQGRKFRKLARRLIKDRRTLPLKARLAYDFELYLLRLLNRLNLTDVRVKAQRHAGRVTDVRYQVTRRTRIRPAAPLPAASARSYTPEEMRRQLESRISRLTRRCVIRFGTMEVTAAAGAITRLKFTDSIIPDREEFSRYFTA